MNYPNEPDLTTRPVNVWRYYLGKSNRPVFFAAVYDYKRKLWTQRLETTTGGRKVAEWQPYNETKTTFGLDTLDTLDATITRAKKYYGYATVCKQAMHDKPAP